MKVWVTGAKGVLGTALQQELLRQGIAFVASSHREADVSDLSSLEKFYRRRGPFTHIIHCAAYTNVDQAEEEWEEAWRVNALAPKLLGNLAAKEGMKMVHLSTDYVFKGNALRPYMETDPVEPSTVYGKTKAEGEAALLAAHPGACIVRTSWLFGLTGRNFVLTMLDLMRRKEEVRVVADQRGRPTYAPDLARALIEALDWSGIYHIANSGWTTWYSFALTIRETALSTGILLSCYAVEPVTSEEYGSITPRPNYSVLDTSKADASRGKPLRSWREGLKECLAAFA